MDFTFSLPLLTQFVLAGEAWEECSLLLGFHLKDSSLALLRRPSQVAHHRAAYH